LDKKSLQDFILAVESEDIKLNIDKRFKLDQIVKAHEYMESNQSKGKIVVAI